VYSKATNGEKFTTGIQQVAVPAGVTILGTLADDFTSRLQGATGDSYGLNLKGTVTVRNLIVSGFPVGIRALQGVQTMKTVILDQNTLGLDLRGSAKATLTGSSVFLTPSPNLAGTIIGANLSQQAQLTLVGGSISGAGQNCRTNVAGVVLNDGSRLTMKSSATLKDIAGNALSLGGTSKALLTGLAAIDRNFSQLAGGCTPTPSVVTRDSASLTLKKARIVSTFGTSSIGVLSNSRALLTLDSAQVVGHSGAGIKSLGMLRLVSKPGSLIKGNSFGIDVSLALTDITISGTTITGNTVGIRATFFKLRNSKVTLNEVGILVTGAIGADLGLTSDPGNNTITGNGIGVKFEPVEFDTEGTVDASGNTWEPFTQGSDGSGHYLQKPLVSGTTLGKNFQLTAFGTDIQL
jgi:hypothetical protein